MVWKLFARLWLALLSLRYTVELKGLEKIKPENFRRKGGVLFLPNHSSLIEPQILFALLWPKYRMQPLIIEHIFRIKLFRPIMRLIKALPVPNFDTSINEMKVQRAERLLSDVAQSMREGKNFLIYPAGHLKSGSKEVVGGASGAHYLIQQCPDVNVVLIRTTGFWGSSFSRAILGRTPEVRKALRFGVKTIFRNFIFFCPRRKITIEFETEPADFPRENSSRIDFNRYLENWYNQYPDEQERRVPEEPLLLLSYSFWKKDLLEPYAWKRGKKNGPAQPIPNDLRNKVYKEIRKILDRPNLEIRDEMNLATDFGMDSLNLADLTTFLSKNFEIGEMHPDDMTTVQSVLEIAVGTLTNVAPDHEAKLAHWPEETGRPDPVPPMGKTIPAAFLNACERMGGHAACGDDLAGVLSYKKLKRAAVVLALHFRTFEDKYIGVLLPSTAGAYIVILALQLAGKVPVMLNWTLGPRYIDEMMRLSGAKFALSSWRFLDRLSHVQLGSLTDRMVLLEDIRDKLSLFTKVRGALLAKRSSKGVQRALGLTSMDENDHAVILFTSGTEASPKGVPLSHKNIIYNLRSGAYCLAFIASDVLYGILPPFHSFGFSVAGLYSIMAGLRLALYPDPTDSFALAEGIERWKVTIFCTAPSFLRGVFQAAKPHQLDSVRFFVTGAEKAPQEFFEKVESLNTEAKLIEGYGITECSPILTLNRPNLPHKGVGYPVPDVEVLMIHPETLEPLPPGSEGEICVRGPNVFKGYLDNPRSPFIEIEGKQWYRTGDLGRLEEGALILSGRLKRFVKIGGEMISLEAIEVALSSELIREGKISIGTPSLAVISEERDGVVRFILFSIIDLDREQVTELLSKAGFSRLVKISEVRKIDEIPLMGAGKIDFRRLQSTLNPA